MTTNKEILSNDHSQALIPNSTVTTPTLTLSDVKETPAAAGKDISISHFFKVLWRYKWLVLSLAVVGLLFAFMASKSIPKVYQAKSTIRINSEPVQVVDFGDLQNNSRKSTPDIVQTEYELLKSRLLAQHVIEDMQLEEELLGKKTGFFQVLPELRSDINNILHQLGVAPDRFEQEQAETPENRTDRSISAFSKRLFVQPVEQSRLVKVYFEASEPAIAAKVTNTLIDTYISMRGESKSQIGKEARKFLEQELDRARSALTNAEQRLLKYAKRAGILDPDNKQTINVQKITGLNQALIDAGQRRLQAESRYQQMVSSGNAQALTTNLTIQSMKGELTKAQAEYQELARLYKPAYPSMQRLNSRIVTLQQNIAREAAEVRSVVEAEYLASKQAEDKLQGRMRRLNSKMEQTRDKSVEYNVLRREVEASQKLYDSLLRRLNEVTVATGTESSIIQIIDEARSPLYPVRPKLSLNLLIGLLGGLGLGLVIAFARDNANDVISSDGELEAFSGLPVLGVIPKQKRGKQNSLALTTMNEARSPLAEAYRMMLANLGAVLNKKGANSILVSSLEPGEGKSTCATNIAMAYAKMQYKVLLIDADMRCPTIHLKLNLENQVGLSNYLDGSVNLPDIHNYCADVNLHVLAAGTEHHDPVGLLASSRMAALLRIAELKYDFLIIDAPPIKGFADVAILSKMVNQTVVLTSPDSSKPRNIAEAIKRIKLAGGNITGFVRVKVNHKETVGKSYYDHYYERGYA